MENMYPVRTPKEILKSKTCEFLRKKSISNFAVLWHVGTIRLTTKYLSIHFSSFLKLTGACLGDFYM